MNTDNMKLAGRVGMQPAKLACMQTPTGIRVDCQNNLEFWLELNMLTGTAKGRVPTELYMLSSREAFEAGGSRKPFVVRPHGAVTRVEHPACAEFWLDISMS